MATIEKVLRPDCFGNPTFAGFVAELQEARELPPEQRDPLDDAPPIRGRFVGSSLLRWPCPSLERFGPELGAALVRTLAPLQVTGLLCAFESPCPWLHQQNDHPPVRQALDRAAQWLGGDPSFDGGLRADLASLPELVSVVFWLGRCCASLPYLYLVPPREPYVMGICRYGVLHVEHYDPSERARFERAAGAAGLVAVERCGDAFEDEGASAGRRILVQDGLRPARPRTRSER